MRRPGRPRRSSRGSKVSRTPDTCVHSSHSPVKRASCGYERASRESAVWSCLCEGMVEEESPKGRRGKRNNSLEADETILLDTTSVLGRLNAPYDTSYQTVYRATRLGVCSPRDDVRCVCSVSLQTLSRRSASCRRPPRRTSWALETSSGSSSLESDRPNGRAMEGGTKSGKGEIAVRGVYWEVRARGIARMGRVPCSGRRRVVRV